MEEEDEDQERRKTRENENELDGGDDGLLLDGGRALETVGVDATEELLLEGHVVEVVDLHNVLVLLDLSVVEGGLPKVKNENEKGKNGREKRRRTN